MGIEAAAETELIELAEGGADAGRLAALRRIIRRDPAGAAAEAARFRLAALLSRRLKAVAPALAPEQAAAAPATFAAARSRPSAALGAGEWLKLVPAPLREGLFADTLAVQAALLADPPGEAPAAGPGFAAEAAALCRAEGVPAAVFHVLRNAPAERHASLLADAASLLAEADAEAALRLWWFAYAAEPGPARARQLAQKMFKAGDVSSAGPLMRSAWSGHATAFIGELLLADRLAASPPAVPPRRAGPAPGAEVAYVASSTAGFRQIGYTLRTQALLAALQEAGTPVRCYARPGYPWDRRQPGEAETAAPEEETVAGIRYAYTRVPDISREPDAFVERMADGLAARFAAARPRLVHAASNHRNALPALIAARRLGLPFVYEVRGLWELTAASRNPAWERSERFALERRLELLVAGEADRVLAITGGVAAELAAGGVPAARIALLPNAVDPERFRPQPRDPGLAASLGLAAGGFTLVWCGTVTAYEGLDDLAAAVGLLAARGIAARLLVVGDGPYLPALKADTAAAGLGAAVTFVPPVPAAEVPAWLALADAVAVPRKPFRVCEIVSPLKPFEAMAMAKPVVLSDLAVSREIVRDGDTGLLAPAADPAALAARLETLARDPGRAAALGAAGRAWVAAERSWRRNAERLQALYAELTG